MNWRYYETWNAPFWRINNDQTGMFFQTGNEDWARWLTDKLNDSERITRFYDGIALTDDGDLVKFVKQDNNDIYHPYTGE